MVGPDSGCQQFAGLQHNVFILGQAREQLIRRALCAKTVRGRQGLAMLFHLVGAKQLRAQRWRIADGLQSRTAMAQPRKAMAAQARPQAQRSVA